MRANYVKLDPTGNTTGIILDPFPRALQPKIAAEMMKPSSLAVEQVGFFESPTLPDAVARLQMMGGEFCGNATRAFAVFLAERRYPGIYQQNNDSNHLVVPLEVSGYKGLIFAEISDYSDSLRKATVKVSMPAPIFMRTVQLSSIDAEIDLVAFEGIVHLVVWNVAASEKVFYSVISDLKKEQKTHGCVGVMFYDEKNNFLTPVVYVEQIRFPVWESSCGSGTVAVGAALAKRQQGTVNCELVQPGGVIGVEIIWDNKVVTASIKGEVSYKSEGVVYLDGVGQ